METVVPCSAFALEGNVCACQRYGSGHINATYRLTTDRGRAYILQQINRVAFREPVAVMENVIAVIRHLRERVDDPRSTLQLVPTRDGRPYLTLEDGGCWRMYDFVLDGVCLQAAETPEDFYQSAVAFGEFQNLLADFPAERLYPVIPNFHNTVNRYENLKAAVDADVCGRVADVQAELDGFLAREETGGTLHRMMESGALPLRVTHNDTKLNNVLLDPQTGCAKCVLDLDTVMPGLSAYDFGDGVRFGASSAAEDEKDLDQVWLKLDMYQAFLEGYLDACGHALTPKEIEVLPLGAKIITAELAMRFLKDYLDGDVYFKIDYPTQNLDRCRTQFMLVKRLIEQEKKLKKIVKEFMK